MSVIKSIECLNKLKSKNEKVLLLFSGGLDSTYLLVYMKETLGLDVICLNVNVGQEESVIEEDVVKKYAYSSKSVNAIDEFVNDFALKAIINQGLYLRRHPLSSSLSRPLFAKIAVEVAKKQNCNSIIHCATSTQNSLRRYNTSIKDLGFEGAYGSPFENTTPSRSEKIVFLKNYQIEFSSDRSFSFDTNIWCREFESGNLGNPENIEICESNFKWTQNKNTLTPSILKVEFDNGVPVSVNNKQMNLKEMITYLNEFVGKYKIGRFCSLEEGPLGKKVIEVREAPGATILINALWELISASFSLDTLIIKKQLDELWTKEVCEGRWYGDLKESIDAFSTNILSGLIGEVSYCVNESSFVLNSVKSNKAKYSKDRERDEVNESLLHQVDEKDAA